MPACDDLERLYDEHAQALFAFLLNLMRHEADTRDVLQDIFVKLARQPELIKNVRDERAFLLRLAHNRAVDLMRSRSSRKRNDEAFATQPVFAFAPAADPDEQAFRRALADAMAELPSD